MKTPCLTWMFVFSLVAGCGLIAGGTILLNFVNIFKNMPRPLKQSYNPLREDIAIVLPGTGLIIAGILYLIRAAGMFCGLEESESQARRELIRMAYGFPESVAVEDKRVIANRFTSTTSATYSAHGHHRDMKDASVEVCLERTPLGDHEGTFLHRHGTVKPSKSSDLDGLEVVEDKDKHFKKGAMLYKIPDDLVDDVAAKDPKPDYCQTKELEGAYQGATLHHHEFEKSADEVKTSISSDHYGSDREHVHLKEVGTERSHKFVPKSQRIPSLSDQDKSLEDNIVPTAIPDVKDDVRENIQLQVNSVDVNHSETKRPSDIAENIAPVSDMATDVLRPLDLHDQNIDDAPDAEVNDNDHSTEEVQININDQVCIDIKEKTEDSRPAPASEVPSFIVAPVSIQTKGDGIAGCPKYPSVSVPAEIHLAPTGAGDDDDERNNEIISVDEDINNGVIAVQDEIIPTDTDNTNEETSPYDIEKTVGGVKIAERVRVIEDVTLVDLVPNPSVQNQNQ